MNELRLTIPGSIRSKKNSRRPIIVGGKTCQRRIANIPSKAYAAWEHASRLHVWGSGRAQIPALTCPVHIEAHFFYKGHRPDLSGAMESIADCLQGIIYADDGQIESWDGSRLHHDKDRQRTEIIVRW